jgi:hypothetical protein
MMLGPEPLPNSDNNARVAVVPDRRPGDREGRRDWAVAVAVLALAP